MVEDRGGIEDEDMTKSKPGHGLGSPIEQKLVGIADVQKPSRERVSLYGK